MEANGAVMIVMIVVLAVAAAVLAGFRATRADRASGWAWFVAWAGAGALTTFAVVTGLSIGLFVLPLAFAALWAVAARARMWPDAFGLLVGAAVICLLVGALNRAQVPCPSSGSLTSQPSPCGFADPAPWLAVGVALAAIGAGGYVVAQRQPR